MSKKYFFFIFILILAAVLLYGYGRNFLTSEQPSPSPSPTETPAPQIQKISLTIDFGDGNIRRFENSDNQGLTAFGALKQVAELNNIQLQTEASSQGIFVKAIAEKEGGQDNKYWMYYINDEMPMVAADQYELKPGDRIEWRFEESTF